MTSLSPEAVEIARKNEAAMIRALASVGQKRVAEQLGISESTVCRWKDGDLEKTARSMAAMGLKVVPEDAEIIGREDLESLIHAAKEWAAGLSVDGLVIGNKNPGR